MYTYRVYEDLGYIETPINSISEGLKQIGSIWNITDEKIVFFLLRIQIKNQ